MKFATSSDELGGRFALGSRLGEGGFGVVHEATDRKYGGRVALKLLRADRVAAAARFKREFRSLADVQHPNLVRLFELAAEGDTLYFTMELVDGVDFLSYVTGSQAQPARTVTAEPYAAATAPRRAALTVDATKLRNALQQLAAGVVALHDARKLHCDIKPSNVLVTRDGRVVLLDFGLISELGERHTLGTPGYMAPEQAAGGPVTAAADWFGVGAMLHEALTGSLPAPGAVCPAPTPELQPLADLCSRLLVADPDQRPTGEEVLRFVGAERAVAPATPRLFGRDGELAALREMWREARSGTTTLVRIVGASGIGKTALVDELLAEIGAEALVLRSRCCEQDSVPYKALDGVMDGLAEHVRRTGTSLRTMMPEHAGLIARLFPVLGDREHALDATDSQAQRRRAFLAVRELLVHVAIATPLVLFLDDLQWGDVDSARLLVELLRQPGAPRMLVIASYRPETTAAEFVAVLDDQSTGARDHRIELAGLPEEAAQSLVEHLLATRRDLTRDIGREAAGNPLFIHQLAATAHERDHANVGLADVILARVRTLDDDARRLVETVALAGRPIDELVAIRAAALDASIARAATLAIRHARLVGARTVGDGVILEPAHDRVRETVAASLAPEIAKSGHLRIAEALLELPDPDPDSLVHHFRHADDRPRTRTYAALAAERAEHVLAFDRAASLLQILVELTAESDPGRLQLLERRGVALANAGRAAEAAEAFEQAADGIGSGAHALGLRRRAGELTLRSGHIELGMKRMDRVLREVGVRAPGSRTSANVLALGRRLRLFARGLRPPARAQAPIPAAAKLRLEALWSASTGVSMVNHVLADALGLQHLLEAWSLGERSHLIRGLGYEAAFEAVIGGGYLRKRCARILDVMDELAGESHDPYDRAWAQMSKGVTSWFLGDWPASWRNCDEAAAVYREHCHGVAWELAICDAYRLPALAYLGNLRKLADVVPRAYEGARERGDIYAVNLLSLGQQSMTWLLDDRPRDVLEKADAAIAPFPREPYLLPHYHHVFAVAQAELYRGSPAIAWKVIEGAKRGLVDSKLMMVQCLRAEIRHLRARSAIALAATGVADADKLRAAAKAESARIRRDEVAPAAPFAASIDAALLAGKGDREAARAALASAVTGFEAAHMELYAHAARDRLGALVGGDEGTALRATSARWMAAQGMANPAAMIGMLMPGL